jgi:hypothetical protein
MRIHNWCEPPRARSLSSSKSNCVARYVRGEPSNPRPFQPTTTVKAPVGAPMPRQSGPIQTMLGHYALYPTKNRGSIDSGAVIP